jgi:hypothetical protein
MPLGLKCVHAISACVWKASPVGGRIVTAPLKFEAREVDSIAGATTRPRPVI